MAPTIYLHWTATGYDWIRPGHYHSIVSGDGRVHRLHDYTVDLPAHTWQRNSNSVAIACACMGGVPDPWTMPPTEPQIATLCRETAAVARRWGWTEQDITIQRVMTHAEAASNRDGQIRHDNYGPVAWGGTGERWDLLQLVEGGEPDGGEQLRRRIRAFLKEEPQSEAPDDRLSFRGMTVIQARGADLRVQIDAEGRSWALISDLLQRYEIAHSWDQERRRVWIGARDVAPTFRADGVQAWVGWSLVELSLQTSSAPVILTGILRPGDHGDQGWCRVVEFAEEFGISMAFQPLVLGERRGG